MRFRSVAGATLVAVVLGAGCGSPGATGGDAAGGSSKVDSGATVPWRMLADEQRVGHPYTTHVALDERAYDGMWLALGLRAARPSVDFANEIVLQFAAAYSSSCPDISLDAVVVDRATTPPELRATVDERRSADQACTTDAVPRSFVVAVGKDRLPPVPFVVDLAQCTTCGDGVRSGERVVVASLDAASGVELPLTSDDLWAILGAAARHRVAPAGPVEVVNVLAAAAENAAWDFAGGRPLTDDERTAIAEALAPATVDFVPLDAPYPLDGGATQSQGGPPRLFIARPAVVEGHLAIATQSTCGNVCADGGSNVVTRKADGTWTVGEAIGPQWVS